MQVTALVDVDGTGANITAVTVLTNQTQPNGVVWHQGSLYVAETRRITRYDNADGFAINGQVGFARISQQLLRRAWTFRQAAESMNSSTSCGTQQAADALLWLLVRRGSQSVA